jgi:hypothetical protein
VAAKNAEPAATPSAPSSRLKALVMPTSHSTVTANPNTGPRSAGPNGKESSATRTPTAYIADATATCTANLTHAGIGRMSSTTPSRSTARVPAMTGPRERVVASSVRPVGTNITPTRMRAVNPPSAMATPPMRGTGGLRVLSIAPSRSASAPVRGMNSAHPTAATTNTKRYEPKPLLTPSREATQTLPAAEWLSTAQYTGPIYRPRVSLA